MDKIIGLRAGHIGATKYTGAEQNGLVERRINQDVYNDVYHDLKSTYGFTIINKTGELGNSVYNHYNKYLTNSNYLLLCIHQDSQLSYKKGPMVLCSIYAGEKTLKHAKMFLNDAVNNFGVASRGILQRKSGTDPKKDYYGIIRNTKASVILGEYECLSNKARAEFIKQNYQTYIKKQAETYIKLACSWYGVKYKNDNNNNNNNDDVKLLTNKIKELEKEFDNDLELLSDKIKNLEFDITNLKNIDVAGLEVIEEKIKKIKNIL